MKQIQMVDLQTQYTQIKNDIDQGIAEVITTSAFIKGQAVKDFEAALATHLGVKHVIGTGNGTDALQIALMALDLKAGDEIITPTFTFWATAEVGALLGLKVVLVDVNEHTFNIDIEALKKAITPRTRAIIPVHLFGQVADMQPIMALAEQHNLYVIEDACQSINAEYTFPCGTTRKAGTIGHIGCTSFFPSKNLGCYGDGGALFTNNDELAKRIRIIANHGSATKYHHERIGINSRLDTIQAAVLNAKLPHLNEYTAARQAAAAYYTEHLQGIKDIICPTCIPASNHVFHQYTLRVKNGKRDMLKAKLAEAGIPSMIYYPIAIHLQEAMAYLKYKKGDCPVAEQLCTEVLSLPMHTCLDQEQQNYILTTLKEALA